jgi:hypothetical protein
MKKRKPPTINPKKVERKPKTGKELIIALVGAEMENPRIDSLKRLLRCMEHPDLRTAMAAAIAEDWSKDMDCPDMAAFVVSRNLGERLIDEAIGLAAECEQILIRGDVYPSQ